MPERRVELRWRQIENSVAGLVLFGVSPADVATYVAVAVVLGVVVVIASWIPARRATQIDPMVALRQE